jgi:mRNA interferase RelE/StbE
MAFQIEYSQKAFKELQKLEKQVQEQILKRLERLSENPELAKPLGNVFKNYFSEHVGKYRIIFSIKENTIIVAKIAHRKNVYG